MKRNLGNDLKVYPVGLGCMGMSAVYGGQEQSDATNTLRHAVDIGVTMFDTAEAYGPFANETLLGSALKPVRDNVILATKFGFEILDRGNGPEETGGLNGRPEHAKAVAEASLKRLKTDVIDLFYLHRVDPKVPIEDTVGGMADLVREGKVRALGLSEVSVDTIKRAHSVHPISAIQSEYSLWTRDPENGVLEICKELGIGFVPFSPLGRGFLTGTIKTLDGLSHDDFRRELPRFEQKNLERNIEAIAKLEKLAVEKDITPAQLSLAWVLHQGDFIVPIPGARKIGHLEQNSSAARISLSASDIAAIGAVLSPDNIAGNRYTDENMALVNQ